MLLMKDCHHPFHTVSICLVGTLSFPFWTSTTTMTLLAGNVVISRNVIRLCNHWSVTIKWYYTFFELAIAHIILLIVYVPKYVSSVHIIVFMHSTCGGEPEMVIMDATSLAFRKDVHIWQPLLTANSRDIPRKSGR